MPLPAYIYSSEAGHWCYRTSQPVSMLLHQPAAAVPAAFADSSTSGNERADIESSQQSRLQSKKSELQASRSSVVGMQSMGKQGSTMMRLTGRLSSLFPSMKSNADEYQQHEDDLSGSSYQYRDY